jgi:hypothetical protein
LTRLIAELAQLRLKQWHRPIAGGIAFLLGISDAKKSIQPGQCVSVQLTASSGVLAFLQPVFKGTTPSCCPIVDTGQAAS